MNDKMLLEYVSIVMDLEKDKYSQSQAIKQLEQNVASMKAEKEKNEAAIKNTVTEYDLNAVEVQPEGHGCLFYAFLLFLGYVLSTFFDSILSPLLSCINPNQTSSTLVAYILGFLVAVILIICYIIKDKKEPARLLEKKKKEIEQSLENNKKLNQKRMQRNYSLGFSIPKVQKEREVLVATNNETETLLQKYYALNVIPEAYRNLVAVCSFYSYLSAGRTYTIRMNVQTHDEGAVNIFEREQKMGLIISKLDQVVHNLQALREEQSALRYAIEEGNRVTHSLLEKVDAGIGRANNNLACIRYQKDQELKYQQYMASAAYQYYTKSFD